MPLQQVANTDIQTATTFTFSNTQFGLGSAASPSIAFTGDTNTGIFSPAADTLAFAEGGTEVMRITNAGDVGIGTTSPNLNSFNKELTVNAGTSGTARAAINIQGSRTTSSTFGALNFFHQTNIVGSLEMLRGGADNSGVMQFFTANAGTIAERMRIDSSGNLGIGTSSPASKLDVNGIYRQRADYNIMEFYKANGSTRLGYALFRDDGANFYVVETNQPLAFYTNNTERMRITSAGNVGIGTSIPAAFTGFTTNRTVLQVQNSNSDSGQLILGSAVYCGLFDYDNAAGNITIRNTYGAASTGALIFIDSGTLAFRTGTSYTERMRIDSDGNVGIGTSSPGARLHVNSSTTNTIITAQNTGGELQIQSNQSDGFINMTGTGDLQFRTGPSFTGTMRILANGNVGIGTSNPASPLQVIRNSTSVLLNLGSAGTNATGTINAVTNCLAIGRSVITAPPNTATNLVSGYGGNMLLISLAGAPGVADIQYTFVVTGGWSSTTVLFSNSYGVNTATFTFSAVSGVTRVSHNHSGNINFTVHALTGPGPAG